VEDEEGEGEDEEKRRCLEGGRGEGGGVKEEGGRIRREGEGHRLITIYSDVTAGAHYAHVPIVNFFETFLHQNLKPQKNPIFFLILRNLKN
jgi:hypothetical protein